MKPALHRCELICVPLLLLAGVWLRGVNFEQLAVEHFDEGVYASNLYSPLTGHRYPDQHLYAPPLLPWLLEWCTVARGPQGAMWVNIAAGCLSLPVAWLMFRAWCGPPAAFIVLTLLAFSEFHMEYSRAALTDALWCLWLLLGLWTGTGAIERGGVGRVLLAGGLAALAWWTKYNGWLVLAMTGAGAAGWFVVPGLARRVWGRRGRTDSGRASAGAAPSDGSPFAQASSAGSPAGASPSGAPPTGASPSGATPSAVSVLFRWLAIAAMAFLLWSPWLWELQPLGGYAAVAQNHAGYFGGLTGWPQSAARQLAVVALYGPARSLLGACGALLFVSSFTWTDGGPSGRRSTLPKWVLAAWVIGLTVAVPLYRPYPRLALPWLLGVYGALGALLGPRLAGRFVEVRSRESGAGAASASRRPRLIRAIPAAAALVLLGVLGQSILSHSRVFESRRSAAIVAERVLEELQPLVGAGEVDGRRAVVYVVAEPAVYFHLAAREPTSPLLHITQAASNFGMAAPERPPAAIPEFVVAGPHADLAAAEALAAAGSLAPVALNIMVPSSDLVGLDEVPPWELWGPGQRRSSSFSIYRVAAGGRGSGTRAAIVSPR